MEKASIRKAHRVFRVEVVGSNPADPTARGTGTASAKIFKTLWGLKKSGQSEGTLKAKGERLRHLAKHVDLDNLEAVNIDLRERNNHGSNDKKAALEGPCRSVHNMY